MRERLPKFVASSIATPSGFSTSTCLPAASASLASGDVEWSASDDDGIDCGSASIAVVVGVGHRGLWIAAMRASRSPARSQIANSSALRAAARLEVSGLGDLAAAKNPYPQERWFLSHTCLSYSWKRRPQSSNPASDTNSGGSEKVRSGASRRIEMVAWLILIRERGG